MKMNSGICLGGPLHGITYATLNDEMYVAGDPRDACHNPNGVNASAFAYDHAYADMRKGVYRWSTLSIKGEGAPVCIWEWLGWR